jgi:ubiquinone/menaquinone biosynthesis C-methylase UbiE
MTSNADNDANPTYRLSAAGREAAEDERLSLLETIFDPASRRRRSIVQRGWRCLEVGAGRGSMAVWLAQQVGEKGQVVATDIDVRFLQRLSLPNLEVRRHNILEDPIETLSLGSFDMVSSRLVLFWLVGRQEEAIRRMVQCLRPGGWLVDEDGDWGTVVPVNPFHPMYERYQQVWKKGDWWTARGYDPEFGRKLPALIERCGLQNIRHEAHAEVLRGTTPWGRWWLQTLAVMRASDEAGGALTEARKEEYGILTAPWSDPSFWFQTAVIHACWAQRPASPTKLP